ncbi:hypothetical protein JL721_12083 [Aureococcus anophagefferens]|nr:hypothetical protein JL721_12083 [Aureococcus anophagefferens]
MADLGAVVDAGGGDEAEALFREAMSKQRLATFSLALRGEGSGDDALGPRDFFEGLDGDGALARVVDAYRVGALDDGRAPDDAAGLDRYLADAEAAARAAPLAAVDDDEEQPAAWRAGVGSELMAGAWAIVESARGHGLRRQPGAAKILREAPCFRAATAEAWDPTGAFFAAAARLALTAGADALRRRRAAAVEVTRARDALWSRLCAGVAGPDRAPLVALSLLRARAAEQLGDFAAARRLVGSNVGGALHHVALERGFLESENASLDMGEAEAAEVLQRVATRRGPFPERDVAPETDGWRSFDASPGRDVDNFLLADEELTLVLWSGASARAARRGSGSSRAAPRPATCSGV